MRCAWYRVLQLTFVLCLIAPPAAFPQSPNVVLFQADDWGWPYYGFMQRYLAAKVTGTCVGGSADGAPCTGPVACPGGTCNADLVGDNPDQPGREYLDPQLILVDVPSPGRPPMHRLITPALDWLAEHGNFFPLAHNSASHSQPSLAITMTGLFPADYVLTPLNPPKTTSPVLPEWVMPAYLTMAAGKWEWGLSHVAPPGFAGKKPWDRQMPKGGGSGEDGRLILKPYAAGDPHQQALQGLALQRVKDFIACARCTDPSKCLTPPTSDREPDSARLAARAAPGACVPMPFFIIINPFIPHANYRPDDFCPYYPRDAQQCALEPWASHSLYCNDPAFDWSCPNYTAAVTALGPPANRKRKLQYVRFVNAFDRAVDELMVHLRCPGGGNPDCGEDLVSNTVIMYRSDHGFELTASKGKFSEHGFRTPTVVWDPRPGHTLPASSQGCASQPGCRNDFAHAIDILATLRDVSGSTFQCDDTCAPCDPTCPNACPCDRPDGLSRYSEGRSLQSPTLRTCGSADPDYLQCLFGLKKGSSGLQPDQGWYVLAEVADGTAPTHLCKFYVACGKRVKLHDLASDPNEKRNLDRTPTSFCGARMNDLIDILRTNLMDKGWYDPCFEVALP
jgi:arylsulfatase A-like enzyme